MVKILVVLIIILIILYLVINLRLKKTNYYKNQFIDFYKFKDKVPHALELVNLGSNHPKFGFDYAGLGFKGMNWGVGPQSLEYDFKMFKQYHNCLKENAVVLIPICPFSFFLYRYKDDSANYKYYPFLNPELINNYSRSTKFFHIDNPLLTAKRNIIRLIKDVPVENRFDISSNPMSNEEIIKDAHYWIDVWKKQFQLNDLAHIDLSEENMENIQLNIQIIKELISFCMEHEYKPVFVLLPVTNELSSHFPDSFVNKHIIEYIQKANAFNIPFLNYLNDTRFTNTELYFNSFFFNTKGRSVFTKTIIEDLKKMKFL